MLMMMMSNYAGVLYFRTIMVIADKSVRIRVQTIHLQNNYVAKYKTQKQFEIIAIFLSIVTIMLCNNDSKGRP